MALLFGTERSNRSIEAGGDVLAWKKREQASLNAWRGTLLDRTNQAEKLELSEIPALLDVAGNRFHRKELVYPEQNGYIGKKQRWTFLQSSCDTGSLASEINRLVPGLNSQIDYFARSTGLERDLLLQGIILTNALLDSTGSKDGLVPGEDFGEQAVALKLDDMRSIRLRRFVPPWLNKDNVLIGASVEYYSKVRIQETILRQGLGSQGLGLINVVCSSLIFARGILQPREPVDSAEFSSKLFSRLFSLVLLLSSHAVVGDDYVREQQEGLGLPE